MPILFPHDVLNSFLSANIPTSALLLLLPTPVQQLCAALPPDLLLLLLLPAPAGLHLVQQLYTYCKKYHPKTLVMAAGIRTKEGERRA